MQKSLAFCLFKYFPHGGLQRDMLRIALACQARGYAIDVYTTQWQGDVPESVRLHVGRARSLTNHGRMQQYHAWVVGQIAQHRPGCVVGFNKMPDLDIYYAADGCYQAKALERRGRLYRLTPRYRQYLAFEKAVFNADSRTHILMLSQRQEASYLQCYRTPANRIHRLPPNMAPDRMPGSNAPEIRRALRRTLGLDANERLLLQVASSFHTKGLDRSIRALAALPGDLRTTTHLYVAGNDTARPYQRLARRLGVADRVVFLGPRDDVPRILVSSDLLMHPARDEAAGIVLLEALACGVPVVASGVCGHAPYVEQARAGWVLPEPFDQDTLDRTVRDALTRKDLPDIGRRGTQFALQENLCGMVDAAVEVIERVAQQART